MKQRYFIFFYTAIFNGNNALGHVDIVTDDHFPPMKAAYKTIQGQHNFKFDEVIITNFIELDEDDFLDWNRKE